MVRDIDCLVPIQTEVARDFQPQHRQEVVPLSLTRNINRAHPLVMRSRQHRPAQKPPGTKRVIHAGVFHDHFCPLLDSGGVGMSRAIPLMLPPVHLTVRSAAQGIPLCRPPDLGELWSACGKEVP